MTTRMLTGWALGVCVAVAAMQMPADETSGRILSTGFGRFTLDENGSTREFNLFSGKSQYDPATWRPTEQDSVKVTFATNQLQKRKVLAVERITLIQAGPNTVPTVDSPVVADVVDVGASSLKARLPSGQVAKFSYQRGTQYMPAGWTPAVGERVRIESHAQPTMVFTVSFIIDRVERVGAASATPVKTAGGKTQ